MKHWSILLWLVSAEPTPQGAHYIVPEAGVEGAAALASSGVRAEGLGLARVYNSLVVDARTAVLAGEDVSRRVTLLLVDRVRQSQSDLVELPRYESDACFPNTVLFKHPLRAERTLLGWVYLIQTAGQRFDESETFLQLFLLEGGRLAARSEPVRVAYTDVAEYLHTDRRFVWRYLAVDKSRTGDELPGPAVRTDARVLLRDVNGDGISDVVVWERVYRSRRIGERGPDFELEEERLSALALEAENARFSPLPLEEKLPAPDAALWDSLPSIGFTRLPS